MDSLTPEQRREVKEEMARRTRKREPVNYKKSTRNRTLAIPMTVKTATLDLLLTAEPTNTALTSFS
jgi:hypothetical protein